MQILARPFCKVGKNNEKCECERNQSKQCDEKSDENYEPKLGKNFAKFYKI